MVLCTSDIWHLSMYSSPLSSSVEVCAYCCVSVGLLREVELPQEIFRLILLLMLGAMITAISSGSTNYAVY